MVINQKTENEAKWLINGDFSKNERFITTSIAIYRKTRKIISQ